jgi:hypothetical protein
VSPEAWLRPALPRLPAAHAVAIEACLFIAAFTQLVSKVSSDIVVTPAALQALPSQRMVGRIAAGTAGWTRTDG